MNSIGSRRTRATRPGRCSQRGATLIEVMVAVVVLSIGLLGVAALQASALRSNQSSFDRSQAVIHSYSVLDAMRANANAAREGAYNTGGWMCAPPGAGDRVSAELSTWITGMQGVQGMGGSACGRISCDATRCQVSVRWDDSRVAEGDDAQSVELVTRL
jgi:type IV pilus assembly protein PilV